MDSAHGREDFLGELTCSLINGKHFGFDLVFDTDGDSNDDDNGRDYTDGDEREFPLHCECHDEGGDKSGYSLYSQAKLLRYATVHVVGVGRHLNGDRCGLCGVKVCNILPECMSDEVDSQGIRGSNSGYGDKDLDRLASFHKNMATLLRC